MGKETRGEREEVRDKRNSERRGKMPRQNKILVEEEGKGERGEREEGERRVYLRLRASVRTVACLIHTWSGGRGGGGESTSV